MHAFRHAVARALDYRWPTRAYALHSCGEAGVSLDCEGCGQSHLHAYRCGARACPICARIASAITVERIARRAEAALAGDLPWDGIGPCRRRGWRLVTLTQQADAERGSIARFEPRTLRRAVVRARRAFGPWWRSTVWGARVRRSTVGADGRRRQTTRARRDTAFAMGLEVAPGGMVHVHAAVFGEYVPDTELRRLWEKQIGRSGFVKVNRMSGATETDFRDALHEVLKYVSKGMGVAQAQRAANVELALRSLRRVECGGALRRVPLPSAQDMATTDGCLNCGQNVWRWRGVRPASYVAENGGFGLDRWADLHEIPDTERRTRAVQYESHFGRPAPAFITEPDESELACEQ